MSGRDSPSSNQSGNLLTRMASWATYLESEPQHEPDLSIAKTLWLAHAEIERLTRLAEDGAMSARSLEAYQRRAEELRATLEQVIADAKCHRVLPEWWAVLERPAAETPAERQP